MQDLTLPAGCLIAEGLDNLKIILDELLNKSLDDPDFAGQAHYVLYQIGAQRSLIKIDFSRKPYQFWYGDIMGRPATKGIKETIARFLLEHSGEDDNASITKED